MYSIFQDEGKVDKETGSQYKPEFVTFYNLTKGGVDTVEEKKINILSF